MNTGALASNYVVRWTDLEKSGLVTNKLTIIHGLGKQRKFR